MIILFIFRIVLIISFVDYLIAGGGMQGQCAFEFSECSGVDSVYGVGSDAAGPGNLAGVHWGGAQSVESAYDVALSGGE